jgi:tetratricopeptide (TPR) repeat protein
MNYRIRRPLFHQEVHSNIYRMFLWAVLIIAALWVYRGVGAGAIQPVGEPTPTATRSVTSLTEEAETYFTAGDLVAAVNAYQEAVRLDPNNAQAWARMARIQAYASALATNDTNRARFLQDALASIDQAKRITPDDSTVAAIRAFVLDWNASQYAVTNPERAADLLTEAEQEAVRALQIDNTNTLALIFFAEILIDQQKIAQGEQILFQAIQSGEDLMDLHRVYAYLLETQGAYSQAILEYDRAIEIAPNYTLLHMLAGANYRHLASVNPDEKQQTALYEKALDYFDRAAKINNQNRVNNPGPFLSIARTYSQMGQFYAAGVNVQRALEFNPAEADVYGQLGIIFFKSRNYEGSIPALRCAIRGCSAEESCDARYGRPCDPDFDEEGVAVQGLPLSPNTLVYYYTYGSVLAALSRPKDNKCPQALEVFNEIRNSPFGSDPSTLSIIESGEAICDSLNLSLVRPTQTPLPAMTPSPTP